ncbi:MAG: DNA topoisomerase IV subunit A [Planctomycetes bacterium]|nr:DNA topoisomerase IV subunit A [Planctomycetota bacterium]
MAKKTTKSKAAPASAPTKKIKIVRSKRRPGDTAAKLVGMADDIAKQVGKENDPGVDIPTRALSNVSFDSKSRLIRMGDNTQRRSFFNLGQAKKFMQTTLIASGCSELIRQEKTTSIRDLFYHCKHTIEGTKENTFDEQSESDPIIEDLEVTVAALREELGLFAEPKGAMVGPMVIEDNGDTIDLSKMGSGGWAIPSIVEDDIIKFKRGSAKYILLIEKGAVWRRFSEDRYWEQHKCMIIHGGGQPPRGVRRLIWRMHNELKLPVYVLVDNDPWGYYIYSVVKQGSINLAFESERMAIPSARFIGMSAFDAERFDIPKTVAIKLNDQDIRRAKEVLNYEWFQKKEWQKEIKKMLSLGVKLELEALSNKDFSFITEQYLPRKLKDKQWLD